MTSYARTQAKAVTIKMVAAIIQTHMQPRHVRWVAHRSVAVLPPKEHAELLMHSPAALLYMHTTNLDDQVGAGRTALPAMDLFIP